MNFTLRYKFLVPVINGSNNPDYICWGSETEDVPDEGHQTGSFNVSSNFKNARQYFMHLHEVLSDLIPHAINVNREWVT
jgi:hypothetical protein